MIGTWFRLRSSFWHTEAALATDPASARRSIFGPTYPASKKEEPLSLAIDFVAIQVVLVRPVST
jgi:hypothetical protein